MESEVEQVSSQPLPPEDPAPPPAAPPPPSAHEDEETSTRRGGQSGRLCCMVDAHLFALPSQPNVYTLCRLCTVVETSCCTRPGGTLLSNRLLVASSQQRKVFSFEYVQGLEPGLIVPAAKEVPFTYIPSGAEIIAIDAFNKSLTSNDFVIGITITKSGENESSHYLNIYTDWESGSRLDLETVAQSCLSLELDFVPYHLFHTLTGDEYTWLLSGSDHMVHVYREDPANHRYQETSSARELFPEFAQPFPSTVLWMDVKAMDGRRLSAVGCECGAVRVFKVEGQFITGSWDVQHSGPITSVRLFELTVRMKAPDFLQWRPDTDESPSPVNLLVTNSLEPSCVYNDVSANGLSSVSTLPKSERFDTVLCSTLADVDMDGRKEILLGTYGQELLVYNYSLVKGSWELSWQRSFANPILSLDYLDITGDVLNEFVVLTAHGLHILQHNPEDVSQLLLGRLQNLLRLQHKST